jgi:Flp pilus assembly protein TadG
MIGREAKSWRENRLTFGWLSAFCRLCSWHQADGGKGAGQSKRRLLGEDGAAIVEMALGSMILLSMIMGTLEMCLALYTYNFTSEAAREGARYAIVRGSSCTSLTNCGATSAQIQTYVQGLYGGSSSVSNMTVTTTWLTASSTQPTTWTSCGSTQCNDPGNAVQVTVTYAFPLNLPFLSKTTLTMSSTSQIVIAN